MCNTYVGGSKVYTHPYQVRPREIGKPIKTNKMTELVRKAKGPNRANSTLPYMILHLTFSPPTQALYPKRTPTALSHCLLSPFPITLT
eukprot:701258-Amorphochlora_amoeboformis.AAC.1